MRDRVAELIGDRRWTGCGSAPFTRWRHASCDATRRRRDSAPTSPFSTPTTRSRLVKTLAEDANIDSNRWPARSLHAEIQRFKDRGLGPEKVSPEDAERIADGKIGSLYNPLPGAP